MPLKRAARVIAGQSPPSEDVSELDGTELPFIQGNAEFGPLHPVPRLQCATAPKRATRGDVLLSVRAPVGALNVADRPLGIGRGLCAIRPGTSLDPTFAWWMAVAVAPQLAALATGATYDAVSADNVQSLPIALPPLRKQRAIADYLDRETARIDALIAARRRMLELLGEQVRARVDRGIRGDITAVAYTRSTVIGPVPRDWDVMHLRRVASIYSGTTFPHEYQGRATGDYPLFKVADLATPGNETLLGASENWVDQADLPILRAKLIPARSVVFPRVGAALLLNARRITTRPSLLDDNSRALHFRCGDVRYWRYLMTLIDFGELANPGAVPTIGENAILSLTIPVPPESTQRSIADLLDAASVQSSKLRVAIGQQVALLQERREALITAAISGHSAKSEAA